MQTFLNAVKDNAVDDLQVYVAPREDRPVSEVLEEVLEEAGRQEGVVVDEVKAYEPCDEDNEDDEDQSACTAPLAVSAFSTLGLMHSSLAGF